MKILNKKILILIFLLILLFPLLSRAVEVKFVPEVEIPAEKEYAIPKEGVVLSQDPGQTIFKYFAAFYSWGLRAVGIVAVIMIMVAGFMWMSAGGNAQAVSKAKRKMYDALMGLILVVGAYWLLSFINPSLVQAPKLAKLTENKVTGKELKISSEYYNYWNAKIGDKCKIDNDCPQNAICDRTTYECKFKKPAEEKKKCARTNEDCGGGLTCCEPREVCKKLSGRQGYKCYAVAWKGDPCNMDEDCNPNAYNTKLTCDFGAPPDYNPQGASNLWMRISGYIAKGLTFGTFIGTCQKW